MEFSVACAFTSPLFSACHDRPIPLWAPNSLSHKFNLSSCSRRRILFTHISACSNSGLHEEDSISKQTVHWVSGQSQDQWNVDNDDEMLRLMEGFKDSFPIIRTYKNDLCTLEVCGSAARASVLTAMASDKSFIATSNLLMGRRLTVRQTVLPGTSGVNSTISTKLFAPSLQIVERAKKLSLPKGLSAGEFLHKFFEGVQMLQLSKFYIEIHAPGTLRNMSALGREERVQTVYSFEASNISALNQFGKALSLYAISGMKSNASGSTFSNFLKMSRNKLGWVPNSKPPIRLCVLSVEEIENEAKLLSGATDYLETSIRYSRPDRLWWPAPALGLETAKRCLDKASDDWIYEHVPMHKMHIDTGVRDIQVAGDATLQMQSEELNLTHAQLVDLAGVFDLYYEDRFTISNKDFEAGAIVDFQCVSRSKTSQFFEAMALGSIILGAGIFAWLVAARMRRPSNITAGSLVLNTVDVAVVSKSDLPSTGKNSVSNFPVNKQLPVEEMESLCKLVVAKLVKAFSWDVQIQSCVGKGAWTECPSSEANVVENCAHTQENTCEEASEAAGLHSQLKSEMKGELATGRAGQTGENDDSQNRQELLLIQEDTFDGANKVAGLHSQLKSEMKGELAIGREREKEYDDAQNRQQLLLFQVALSKDGSVLGFQPLNEAATCCWAAMPFAQNLHKVQKLKPGFWERPLKFRRPPMDVVVLELQMDPALPYVFARPFPL